MSAAIAAGYICTCFTSAVNTADLRSYALQNLVGTHGCPTFVHAVCLPPLLLATIVCAAPLPTISLTCVPTRWSTSLVLTAVLHLYALLVCRQHHRPVFVRIAEPPWYTLLSYIRTCCASAAITTSDIRTCSSSAVNIVDLRSYVLQNLFATHCCPRFVRAARLPSTSLTCIRTCCKTSFLPTVVLHSHLLRICRHCRWLHSYTLLVYQQHC